MGGYAENSFHHDLTEIRRRKRAAEIRASRWRNNYGKVGCYPDLVAVAAFLEDIERAMVAAAEHRGAEARTAAAEHLAFIKDALASNIANEINGDPSSR